MYETVWCAKWQFWYLCYAMLWYAMLVWLDSWYLCLWCLWNDVMLIFTLLVDISCHMHHRFIHDTCTYQMHGYRGSSCKKWHLRPFLRISWSMHKLRGSSTMSLDLKDYLNILLSLNCVVINHQKGGDWKCIWPPKWVLVLMTRTIKELMCLSSYEQVQRLLNWKRAINDDIFAKETVFELNWRPFMIFYFEFEFRKHRTIKRDAKRCLEDAIVILRC